MTDAALLDKAVRYVKANGPWSASFSLGDLYVPYRTVRAIRDRYSQLASWQTLVDAGAEFKSPSTFYDRFIGS